MRPVLGLDAYADAGDYVLKHSELGVADVTRRLAGGTGVEWMLVDTGHRAGDILEPEALTKATGVASREVVRIEAVMEAAAKSGVSTGRALIQAFDTALAERALSAVGLKSIVAYRTTSISIRRGRACPRPKRRATAG